MVVFLLVCLPTHLRVEPKNKLNLKLTAKTFNMEKKRQKTLPINDKNSSVSSPNKNDIDYAKQHGKPAGGKIKIHRLNNKTGITGKFYH